jgi:hypothetical protein
MLKKGNIKRNILIKKEKFKNEKENGTVSNCCCSSGSGLVAHPCISNLREGNRKWLFVVKLQRNLIELLNQCM